MILDVVSKATIRRGKIHFLYLSKEILEDIMKAASGKEKMIALALLSFALCMSATAGFQCRIVFASHHGPKIRPPHPKSSLSLAGASLDSIFQANAIDESLDWSFLDGVYLITCPNADPGGERLQKAKSILDKAGLLDKVQVKEFDTDDENRIRGCYNSHISVLSDVLESCRNTGGKNMFDVFLGSLLPQSGPSMSETSSERNVNVLVVEDNLALSSGQLKQGIIDSVAEYSVTNPDWDMIHLSYIPYVPDLKVTRTPSKDVVKLSCGVGSALGTTAYIINTKAIKRLLEDDKENGGFYAPIPDVMAKLFPESRYASNPTIFVRAPNTKSLVNPQLDDLRSFLFQPSVAAFAQQLILLSGLTTNMLLPIVIAGLLGASGASLVSTFDSLWMLWTTGTLDGPVILPLLSGSFAVFSLGILAQGAMLAPKQEKA